MKKKINYYLVATALFVAIATMVSMTVINYYLFQKQVKEDLQVMAETIESTGILKQDINEIPQIDVEGIRVTWIDKDGTVMYDNQNDVKKLENHGDRPEVESAFDKGTGDCVRTSATMNSNTFYHAIKLNDGTVLRVSIAAKKYLEHVCKQYTCHAYSDGYNSRNMCGSRKEPDQKAHEANRDTRRQPGAGLCHPEKDRVQGARAVHECDKDTA